MMEREGDCPGKDFGTLLVFIPVDATDYIPTQVVVLQ